MESEAEIGKSMLCTLVSRRSNDMQEKLNYHQIMFPSEADIVFLLRIFRTILLILLLVYYYLKGIL